MIEELLTYRPFRLVEMRRDKRMSVPTFQVQVEGTTLQTTNWSLSGLYLRYYPGRLEVGRTVEGILVGTSRNGLETQSFTAEVVRIDPEEKGVALRFDAVGADKVEFFERCLLHLMRPKGGRG
ncbi:MAG: hypothetical protein IRY94_15565 [Rhodospirillaceae bacterium]|nr:hypothetical protein [Rhodospirillaceae bacterium]